MSVKLHYKYSPECQWENNEAYTSFVAIMYNPECQWENNRACHVFERPYPAIDTTHNLLVTEIKRVLSDVV